MKIAHTCEKQESPEKQTSTHPRSLNIGLIVIFAAGLFLAVSVLATYFFYFHGSISDKQDVWASFGSFLSGTLGSLFAFLSFVGILFTVSIQANELDLSNENLKATQQELKLAREAAEAQTKHFWEEMTKSELFNMIKLVHSEFERHFEKKVDFSPTNENLGYYFSNSAPSAGLGAIPTNGAYVSDNDRVLLADLCELMPELNGYIAQYEAQFGASALTYFYKRRYSTCARRLVEKKFLIKEMLSGFQSVGYSWSANVSDPGKRE
jgi:hypothetical protein